MIDEKSVDGVDRVPGKGWLAFIAFAAGLGAVFFVLDVAIRIHTGQATDSFSDELAIDFDSLAVLLCVLILTVAVGTRIIAAILNLTWPIGQPVLEFLQRN